MSGRVMPNAGWPADVLVSRLAKAGWGPLEGREFQGARSVLRAVIDLVPSRKGAGSITAFQVHRATGLSERWTRVCLAWLEDMGVIEWRRGQVFRGEPQPGFIKVCKAWIADLTCSLMPEADARHLAHAAATRRRLAKIGCPTLRKQNRRSDHAEPGSNLPPLRGKGRVKGAPPTGVAPSNEPLAEKELVMSDKKPSRKYLPSLCLHDAAHPIYCPICREEARRAEARDERRQRGQVPGQEQLGLVGIAPADDGGRPISAAQKAYEDYMEATYPETKPQSWWRFFKTDKHAKELIDRV